MKDEKDEESKLYKKYMDRSRELLRILKELKWDKNTGYITKNYFEKCVVF